MIETTYIQLEKAAEELKTDSDTLLIAAIEGRTSLYGLLGKNVDAEELQITDENYSTTSIQQSKKWFSFVPVSNMGACNLMIDGFYHASILTPPDKAERYWEVSISATPDLSDLTDFRISRHQIYMKRTAVAALAGNAHTPNENSAPNLPPETQPPQRQADLTKKRDTLLVIIAALANTAKINIERGAGGAKTIQTCTSLLGVSVSEATILDIIKEIPEAVRRRSTK